MRITPLTRLGVIIALRRTAADWRLQAAVALGMVLAVTLMASGVIYSDALSETALRHTLRNVSAEEVNLSVRVFHALERPAFGTTRRYIEDRVRLPLQPYTQSPSLLIATSTFFFNGLPSPNLPDTERPRGHLQMATRLDRHVRVTEGRLPQKAKGTLEVVTDPLGAQVLGLSVGQEFALFPAVVGEPKEAIPVRVVGIIEPLDLEDDYWGMGFRDRFTNTEREYVTLAMYADGDALFDTVGTAFPGLHTDFIWLFPLDREGLRASEVEELRTALGQSIQGLGRSVSNSSVDTDLEQVLKRYTSLLVLARIPLFLMLFLAVGVVLYSLFLIAGLIGRIRAPEVAQIRSRGGSLGQVAVMLLVEGLLLAVPAVIVGPFLAQALILVVGELFPVTSGEAGLVLVNLSFRAFLLGGVGGLLAVVVLAATTLSVARHGVVEFRRSEARPPTTPLLQRYYLDLVLVALVGLLWWQLRSQGSFLVQPLTGEGLEVDLSLILGPVLGVLVAGLLLLRLFPMTMRLVAWVAEPLSPVWLAQGLRRVARDPIPPGSLVVLLTLAASLGVVGSAFLSTLERSQRDRAQYQAGADLRIRHDLGAELAAGRSVARSLDQVDEGAVATDVVRAGTRAQTENFGRSIDLLAVDPETFPQVAWFRPDFTEASLDKTLAPLRPANTTQEGLPLPANATRLGVWMAPGRLSGSSENVVFRARLRDGRGTYFDMALGQVSGQGWRYLEADIRPSSLGSRRQALPAVVPPYTLHTLWVGSLRGGGGRSAGVVFLDQLQAVTPQGPVELASFQSLEGWHPLEDPSAPGLYVLDLSKGVARPGRQSAAFTWGGGSLGSRGIRAGPSEIPLPALVSSSFFTESQTRVGDVVQVWVGNLLVSMELVAAVDFFPTLDPRDRPFLVVNLASVLQHTAIRDTRPVEPWVELWVQGEEKAASFGVWSQAISDRGGTVSHVHEAAQLVAVRTEDPLLTSGWTGLLALSILTAVLASSTGLFLYTYTEARERQGEFALLRSLGFSRLQVNGMVWFNLALVVTWGVGTGTLGGIWLGNALLPVLEVAEEGTRVTPPMVLQINWTSMATAYGVMVAAMTVTVGMLAWTISRLEVQRLLRIEAA